MHSVHNVCLTYNACLTSQTAGHIVYGSPAEQTHKKYNVLHLALFYESVYYILKNHH